MSISKNWVKKKLCDTLTEPQIKVVVKLLKANDNKGLNTYLYSIESDLKIKGVLPLYLYYYLEYISRKELKC